MAFKLYRPGNPRDPYERPEQPHHIHLVDDEEGSPIECGNHLAEGCPEGHWLGGSRPDLANSHHVEHDLGTGQVGYTVRTDEEIADLEVLEDYEREMYERAEAEARARVDVIRGRAKDDPAFKAIAEHLGIKLG